MRVIGLTGGIGTGKSQVARFLEELGAAVVNADLLGHAVYEPHTDGWRAVVEAFGHEVLTPNGEVDRKKLGAKVFHDPDALRKLNAITHPRIHRLAESRINELKRQGREVVVLEAALLLEAGWTSLVDEIWVVTAPEAEVVKRLKSRNNLSEEAVRARINSQMPQSEREARAHAIIENSGTLAELRQKVQQLWESRVLAQS